MSQKGKTYCDLHSLSADELHGAHDVLLHLHQLRQLLGEIGSEGASGISAERVACKKLEMINATMLRLLTNVALAKESASLGGG